jgi:hypothetical protein
MKFVNRGLTVYICPISKAYFSYTYVCVREREREYVYKCVYKVTEALQEFRRMHNALLQNNIH